VNGNVCFIFVCSPYFVCVCVCVCFSRTRGRLEGKRGFCCVLGNGVVFCFSRLRLRGGEVEEGIIKSSVIRKDNSPIPRLCLS